MGDIERRLKRLEQQAGIDDDTITIVVDWSENPTPPGDAPPGVKIITWEGAMNNGDG